MYFYKGAMSLMPEIFFTKWMNDWMNFTVKSEWHEIYCIQYMFIYKHYNTLL